MLERFDLVVFDWDGTLIDSTVAITRSIQAAAADLGLPVPSDEQASHVIGLGLRDALARAVPQLRPEQVKDFSLRYRHHYFAADATLELFAGARELLAAIQADGFFSSVSSQSVSSDSYFGIARIESNVSTTTAQRPMGTPTRRPARAAAGIVAMEATSAAARHGIAAYAK